ncbi:MAG: phage protein Gp13 family protein [Pseudomonadota bacterium]
MIRKATMDDVQELASNMREDDQKECWDIARMDPFTAAAAGYASGTAEALVSDGGCFVGLAGVVPKDNGEGLVWMLTTDKVKEHALQLVREGRDWLDAVSKDYTRIHNVVTVQNKLHVRLIKAMGFTFRPKVNNYFGLGVDVYPFERK